MLQLGIPSLTAISPDNNLERKGEEQVILPIIILTLEWSASAKFSPFGISK